MRTISPSEATNFAFCQKYWYNRRHLGMIPRKIGYKDLAGFMGSSVGWGVEGYYTTQPQLTIQQAVQDALDEYHYLTFDQFTLGREWDWGVEEYSERIPRLIEHHLTNILTHPEIWLGEGKVICVEYPMGGWGNSRTDMVIEESDGTGTVLDWKCKLKAESDKFSISRDIDLMGNQSELYPLAWNSLEIGPVIKRVRFVYLMEGKLPLIEEKVILRERQVQWLKGYGNLTAQINNLELTPEHIHDKLIENPYHITPWGYPCEYVEYCKHGEGGFGGAEGFIQVEKVKK